MRLLRNTRTTPASKATKTGRDKAVKRKLPVTPTAWCVRCGGSAFRASEACTCPRD